VRALRISIVGLVPRTACIAFPKTNSINFTVARFCTPLKSQILDFKFCLSFLGGSFQDAMLALPAHYFFKKSRVLVQASLAASALYCGPAL
jgi:hypothetical protein